MDSPKIIQVPATITRVSSLSDGGLSIGLHTQELTPAEKTAVLEFHNAFGYFLFKKNQFSDSEVPTEEANNDELSPSERLRNRLFVYWKEKKIGGDFDMWRRKEMERIGQAYLNKLETL